MANIEGNSSLLADGRYPYDGDGAAVVWPVVTADFKLHAQIEHSVEDDLLNSDFGGYIADAAQEVEARGQVSLINQRRRLVLDRLPSEETITIPRGPLVSVESIGYLDADDAEQTLATSLYRVDTRSKFGGVYFKNTAALQAAYGSAVVWIDTTCGYGETPEDVPAQWRELVLIIATHSYQRRELVTGGGLDEAMERVISRKVIAAGAARRYV